jgi:hypothetical protein
MGRMETSGGFPLVGGWVGILTGVDCGVLGMALTFYADCLFFCPRNILVTLWRKMACRDLVRLVSIDHFSRSDV